MVLDQVDCFVQCEAVGSQITLDIVQPVTIHKRLPLRSSAFLTYWKLISLDLSNDITPPVHCTDGYVTGIGNDIHYSHCNKYLLHDPAKTGQSQNYTESANSGNIMQAHDHIQAMIGPMAHRRLQMCKQKVTVAASTLLCWHVLSIK